jgi:hypothetical protein
MLFEDGAERYRKADGLASIVANRAFKLAHLYQVGYGQAPGNAHAGSGALNAITNDAQRDG